MKVLYVKPCSEPEVIESSMSLEEICRLLRADLMECCWPFKEEVCLICDESGWLHDYQPLNRIVNGCIIKGPFILAREKDEDFASLTEEDIQRYTEMFRWRK